MSENSISEKKDDNVKDENENNAENNNEKKESDAKIENKKSEHKPDEQQQHQPQEQTDDDNEKKQQQQQQQQDVEKKSSQKSLDGESQNNEDLNDDNDDNNDENKSPKQQSSDKKLTSRITTTASAGGSPKKRSKITSGGRRRSKGEKLNKQNCRIGFIGAGKMTEMIVKGLLEYANIQPKQIHVSSKSGKTHDHYKQLGCIVTKRNYDIFGKLDCDVIFLAVHGYVIKQCYQQGGLRPMALTTNFIPNQKHPLYILSLIGGITLNDIKRTLLNPDHPDKYQIEMHRLMLNHSVGYGQGYGTLDVDLDSKNCTQIIRDLLTPIARFDYTAENQMDIACALAGCGSAFCYYFLTAMCDGAFKKGLNKAKAMKIATDALRSTAISLLVSGKNPTDLRDIFASPSGPAIYGIHVLDKDDFPSGIISAVEAAYKRIKELTEHPIISST